jgi:hypothetical protein
MNPPVIFSAFLRNFRDPAVKPFSRLFQLNVRHLLRYVLGRGLEGAMRLNDQEANQLRVLKAIRRAEPVARTELVQLTGVAGWAISEVVADLINRNMLVEE